MLTQWRDSLFVQNNFAIVQARQVTCHRQKAGFPRHPASDFCGVHRLESNAYAPLLYLR